MALGCCHAVCSDHWSHIKTSVPSAALYGPGEEAGLPGGGVYGSRKQRGGGREAP